MTVQECINYIDSIEPNAYTAAQKAGWLSECEGKVYTSLFLVQPYEFTPITAADSRVLALPVPYDRMYPRYLQAMIHYANGEYDRYANSMAVFNEVWAEANRWFGGDFDVTDRLRNKRFEVKDIPINESGAIMEIPAGCAIVAGRFTVPTSLTPSETHITTTAAMPVGTYNFRIQANWWHFTTAQIFPVGTVLRWQSGSAYVLATLPDTTTEQCGILAKRDPDGTDIDLMTPLHVVNDMGPVCNVPLTKNVTPMQMVMGGVSGTTLYVSYDNTEDTTWNLNRPHEVIFTGHLLIPDERWSYETQYAGRRDARWRG